MERSNKTAEQLKQDVRDYADREHPGWDVARVAISRGLGHEPELLIITPKHQASVPSLPSESQN